MFELRTKLISVLAIALVSFMIFAPALALSTQTIVMTQTGTGNTQIATNSNTGDSDAVQYISATQYGNGNMATLKNIVIGKPKNVNQYISAYQYGSFNYMFKSNKVVRV